MPVTVLLFWATAASGHFCGEPRLFTFTTNDIGKPFPYLIYSDVIGESQPSGYSVVSVTDTNVVTVEAFTPFSFFFGLYTVTPRGIGATVAQLKWEYAPHAASGLCGLTIQVGTDEQVLRSGRISYDVPIMDPVNAASGELTEGPVIDFDLGGPMPLRFARYYASGQNLDGVVGQSFKQNWSHNFETRAYVDSNHTEIITYKGRRIGFDQNAGEWIPSEAQNIPYQLAQDGDLLTLSDPTDNLLYTFNATNGNMVAISDGKGNVHTLNYIDLQLQQVSDGLGRTLDFTYLGFQNLTEVTDGFRTNYYGFGNIPVSPFAPVLTQVTDPRGFTTTYQYDHTSGNGVLITNVIHPEGNTPFVQVYNTNHQVVSQTSLGNLYGIGYQSGRTTVTNPAGGVLTFEFNGSGEMTSRVDEAGSRFDIEYDGNNRMIRFTDRLGNDTHLQYDNASGRIAELSNAMGQVTTYTYDSRLAGSNELFDLTGITWPDGGTIGFGYDSMGNLIEYTNPVGGISTFTYNSNGLPLVITSPIGGAITNTYNPDGTLGSSSDSDTGPFVYEYDDVFRLTNIISSDGSTFGYEYDANDNVTRVQDGRGNETKFHFDGNNNITQAVDAAGQSRIFTYDGLDRVVLETDEAGESATRIYDERDLLFVTTNRNGHATQFGYDSLGNLTGILDPTTNLWIFQYDEEQRVTGIFNPLGEPFLFEYDPLGNTVGAEDALGHVSRYEYDAMQRVVRIVDPLNRDQNFSYDAAGGLTSAGRAGIGSALYERNLFGLVTNLIDLRPSAWQFSYTPMGRTAQISDPLSQTTTFEYDSNGRPGRILFHDGSAVSNTYDAADNRIRQRYTDSTDFEFGYDSLNRITNYDGIAITRDVRGLVTETRDQGVTFGASYDAGTRLVAATYNNGAFTVFYTYDGNDRLTHVEDNLTGKGMDFSYDSAGRLTGIMRSNGVNAVYTYDPAGRQIHRQESGIIDIQYTYDAADHIITANMSVPLDPSDLVAGSSSTFTYDAANQVSGAGYAYDARGRVINLPGQNLIWDDAERLRQINGVTLKYRGRSSLTSRDMGGVGTNFYYNYAIGSREIMAEQDIGSAQFQRYYVWSPNGRLLYGIDAQSSQVFYYHFDITGNTLALTGNGGGVTDAYAYSIYGKILGFAGSNPQPFTYVGQYGVRTEPAAPGLYHMGARYYHAHAKRFLSRESLWPELNNPQLLNPYQYALNSPIQTIDPDGNRPRVLRPGTRPNVFSQRGIPPNIRKIIPNFKPSFSHNHGARNVRSRSGKNPESGSAFFFFRDSSLRSSSPLSDTRFDQFPGFTAQNIQLRKLLNKVRFPESDLNAFPTSDDIPNDLHNITPRLGNMYEIKNTRQGTPAGSSGLRPETRYLVRNSLGLDRGTVDAVVNGGDLDGYLLIGNVGAADGSYLPRNYDNDFQNQNADLPIWRD